MLYNISMDSKHPFRVGANPKITLAVGDHAGDGDSASVKGGGHERFDRPMFPFCKPLPWALAEHADPERPVGIRHEAYNLAFARVHLRSAGMPMDKCRRSSQPKTTFAVTQQRIDWGNRYSIFFTETLKALVRDVAEGRV